MAFRKTAAVKVEESTPLTGITDDDKNHAYRGLFWGWAIMIYGLPVVILAFNLLVSVIEFLFGAGG